MMVTDGPNHEILHVSPIPMHSPRIDWLIESPSATEIIPTTARATTARTKRPQAADTSGALVSRTRPGDAMGGKTKAEIISTANTSHSNNTNNNNESSLRNSEYSILFCAFHNPRGCGSVVFWFRFDFSPTPIFWSSCYQCLSVHTYLYVYLLLSSPLGAIPHAHTQRTSRKELCHLLLSLFTVEKQKHTFTNPVKQFVFFNVYISQLFLFFVQ